MAVRSQCRANNAKLTLATPALVAQCDSFHVVFLDDTSVTNTRYPLNIPTRPTIFRPSLQNIDGVGP